MPTYMNVHGVRMWYDDRGKGDPAVLLHGGLTDSRDFAGKLARLADTFRLLLPERRGHGHTADVAGPITIELMAQDTAAFLDEVVGSRVRLVGYSSSGDCPTGLCWLPRSGSCWRVYSCAGVRGVRGAIDAARRPGDTRLDSAHLLYLFLSHVHVRFCSGRATWRPSGSCSSQALAGTPRLAGASSCPARRQRLTPADEFGVSPESHGQRRRHVLNTRKGDQGVGIGTCLGRVVHGCARRARRLDRA